MKGWKLQIVSANSLILANLFGTITNNMDRVQISLE